MSSVRKRSLSIRGHRTSVSLEDAFFDELEAAAARRHMALAGLVSDIDARRPAETNLSSALRLFVLAEVKGRAGA
jgi:predicted DNA-binding ribbon-helix-helix protein